MSEKLRVSSGVSQLDRFLGGLFIGDNVGWYDDSGSLALVFCLNFLQASLLQHKPVIYVSSDRSPRNLLEKLRSLAEDPHLTILDGFTCGRGACSSTFMKFYEEPDTEHLCQVRMIDKPQDMGHVTELLYSLLETMEGDVRLIFESMTGMQKVCGGRVQINQIAQVAINRSIKRGTMTLSSVKV